MTSTHSIDQRNPSTPNQPLTLTHAILWATLITGALDATDGVVVYGLRGLNPIQVLQFIASGILGPASFTGGLATAALGTLLHFLIALVAAAAYLLTSRSLPTLRQHAIPLGLLYGAVVYLFMTYVIVAHSAIGAAPFDPILFTNGVLGHALFVGLPTALLARKIA